ncbi:hypothetical protein EVAR_9325_1 [Eumeta japonica]|uniref:Uncharacterized protein n=1 Tax=Eumeta variegata TaxID=151549 RepID=A0A4C1TNL6_EUMVA|nr:hypothetical protein EVAR_9325_1 [Eumeta japonica]
MPRAGRDAVISESRAKFKTKLGRFDGRLRAVLYEILRLDRRPPLAALIESCACFLMYVSCRRNVVVRHKRPPLCIFFLLFHNQKIGTKLSHNLQIEILNHTVVIFRKRTDATKYDYITDDSKIAKNSYTWDDVHLWPAYVVPLGARRCGSRGRCDPTKVNFHRAQGLRDSPRRKTFKVYIILLFRGVTAGGAWSFRNKRKSVSRRTLLQRDVRGRCQSSARDDRVVNARPFIEIKMFYCCMETGGGCPALWARVVVFFFVYSHIE